LEELHSAVKDHVEEEEGKMFDLARKLIPSDEARRLDESFQQEKNNLKSEYAGGRRRPSSAARRARR
jgi:hypothetical protein